MKAIEFVRLQFGVAIGGPGGRKINPIGVGVFHATLVVAAEDADITIEAHDGVEAAVKVDHRLMAGRLVQTVHVLCNEAGESPLPLELGEGNMRRVGLRASECAPPHHGARPIALAHEGVGAECLPGDRLLPGPLATCVPVGRDTGFGAAAGAGDDEQALGVFKEPG